MTLQGVKVLVTGGTGFIGGRLVEKLVSECGARVRVFLRNPQRAGRLAHLPVELIQGDLADEASVFKAVRDCDIVFHCAYGSSGTRADAEAVTVGGTDRMARASLAFRVRRFVHVSTFAVYGSTHEGLLEETAPRKKTGNLYAESKLEAEQIIFTYFARQGLPATVIQPVIVYGPHSGSWTEWAINQLKTSRVVLIDGGIGFCNAVYVDDVVDAMLLASVKESAIGEAFLISAEKPVTWRDFFGAYEKILGYQSTISMTSAEIRRHYKKKAKTATVLDRLVVFGRKIYDRAKTSLPGVKYLTAGYLDSGMKPLWVPPAEFLDFFNSKMSVSISKAREKLGYQPRFDLDAGMAMTACWVHEIDSVECEITTKNSV